MFNSWSLRLEMTTNVNGLDAVPVLRALDLIVAETIDLDPLVACQNLSERDSHRSRNRC